MTRTELERLAVVEERIEAVSAVVTRIEDKLDSAIACKADKTELNELRRFTVSLVVAVAGASLTTLVGIVVFLVERHIIF